MKLFRIFFLILLFLGESSRETLFAQSYNFKNYSAEYGLPSLIVDAIFQDSKGYLWVGGYGGLSKFNGTRFIDNYSPKNGLVSRQITSIAETNDGNIWIGTNSGLNKFDGRAFSTFTTQNGLPGDYITSLTKDKNGVLWIGTTQGIAFYNGRYFESITTKDGLVSNNVSIIYPGKSGVIWIISDKGLSKMVFENGMLQYKSLGKYHFVNCHFGEDNSKIMSITEDDNGNPWFGTNNGVLQYENFREYTTENGLADNYIHAVAKDKRSNDIWVGTSNGLNKISRNGKMETFKVRGIRNGNEIRKLFVDAEGNLWLGTKNGLYRFRDPSFCTFSEQDGLRDPTINSSFRDSKKNLWVGTSKEGAYRYDSENLLGTEIKSPKNFSVKEGLIGSSVYSGMEDKKGNIWLGTNNGVSIYNGRTFRNLQRIKDGLKNDSVYSIIQDSKGRIWLGGVSGGTILNGNHTETFELKSEEKIFNVCYEFEDSKRNIWLGTRFGGLFCYDGKNFVDFSKRLNLGSKVYFAITEDKDGILYFGSVGGVYIYDPSGKKLPVAGQLFLISEENGLSSDLVYSMSLDSANENLYVGTNQGLNKVDLKEFKKSGKIAIKQYGQEEGLSALDFNVNGVWRDTDGTFWLGTVNGLIHFNPNLFYENRIESRTSIKAISIAYQDTILPPNSELNYDENNISFEYIGICLANPGKVRYKYMLEGADKTWSPETKETVIRYSNLAHKQYTFKVISCNNEGVWNKYPATFSFSILRPWWLTSWFWITLSVLVIILVVIFTRLRLQAMRKKQAEKLNREIELASNELKALRAQMDPHFIFNSLSSIQSFIMIKDEESALRYLNKFAKLMRMILINSERPSITIQEEINALNLYLELEALRWDNKFDFVIHIGSDIKSDFHKIPSMLIQPYVENAIIHGVVPKASDKGKIEITISKSDRYVICTIQDNGIGRKKSLERRTRSSHTLHESMGMKITSERLEVLNRIHLSDLSVQVTDLEDQKGNALGTKVEIFIPLR